ncbi:MAG: hypothetical protein M1834_004514 [Cirrosporium novae-zelandiae]|nr:MAG: hypothetical protein M1834_004514 [Cirrosporium novae-zelandiae]
MPPTARYVNNIEPAVEQEQAQTWPFADVPDPEATTALAVDDATATAELAETAVLAEAALEVPF